MKQRLKLTPDRRPKLTPCIGATACLAGRTRSGLRRPPSADEVWRGHWSGAVLEAPGLVAGLDDLTVMGEPVEERGGHLGVAEDGRPFEVRSWSRLIRWNSSWPPAWAKGR